MKEISKKDLLNLIEQTTPNDMEEMAYIPKGVQAQGVYKQGEKEGQKRIPKFKAGTEFRNGGASETPDYWLVNPTQEEGKTVLAVPLGCDDLEIFIQENKEWLKKIGALHGLEPQLIACTRGKYHRPIEKAMAGGYQPSGERYEYRERILRNYINPLIIKNFLNEDAIKMFEIRSIPIVNLDKKHLNNHGEISNNKIEFATLSFDSYLSSQDFLDAVLERIDYADGLTDELPEKHKPYPLARQFNKIYSNWVDTKKNELEYKGKTPKYMLDKLGLEKDNLDVTVKSTLSIDGEFAHDTYNWTVSLKVEFGRKLKEDRAIKDGLSLDKEFVVFKQAPVNGNELFSNQNTVLDNFEINTSLIEAIHELIEKVSATDPIETLNKANYDRTAIEKLAEEKVDNIVKNIINELKK